MSKKTDTRRLIPLLISIKNIFGNLLAYIIADVDYGSKQNSINDEFIYSSHKRLVFKKYAYRNDRYKFL